MVRSGLDLNVQALPFAGLIVDAGISNGWFLLIRSGYPVVNGSDVSADYALAQLVKCLSP